MTTRELLWIGAGFNLMSAIMPWVLNTPKWISAVNILVTIGCLIKIWKVKYEERESLINTFLNDEE